MIYELTPFKVVAGLDINNLIALSMHKLRQGRQSGGGLAGGGKAKSPRLTGCESVEYQPCVRTAVAE